MAWSPPFTALLVSAMQIGIAVALPAHIDAPEQLIEFKAMHGIAGFLGAIISLGIVKYPSFFKQVTVLVAGIASGMYLAPLVEQYLEITSAQGYGVALVMGLVAMPLFTGVHVLATRWRDDPLSVIAAIRKDKRDG